MSGQTITPPKTTWFDLAGCATSDPMGGRFAEKKRDVGDGNSVRVSLHALCNSCVEAAPFVHRAFVHRESTLTREELVHGKARRPSVFGPSVFRFVRQSDRTPHRCCPHAVSDECAQGGDAYIREHGTVVAQRGEPERHVLLTGLGTSRFGSYVRARYFEDFAPGSRQRKSEAKAL